MPRLDGHQRRAHPAAPQVATAEQILNFDTDTFGKLSALLADTVCTHSHALLLLVQLNKMVTTAHEQTTITRDACWKHNF